MLLIPRVQNKILNVPNKMNFLVAFFTLSVYECSTFFFINGIFKTGKLKGSLGACFLLLRAVLKFL